MKRWILVVTFLSLRAIVFISQTVSAQTLETSIGIQYFVGDIAWSPDGDLIAVSGSGGIMIYSKSLQELAHIQEETAYNTSLSWSPDSIRLATVGHGLIFIWSRDQNNQFALEKTLSLEGYLLVLVSWSPDGSKLASQDLLPPDPEELQGAWSRVHIWNTDSWEIEQTLPQEYRYGEITFPFELVWSADSLNIAGTGSDENLHEVVFIANVSTGQYFYPFPQTTQITALDWSSNGLLAAGTNYDLNIYDVNSQQLLYTFQDVYRIRDLSWSPDGTKLLFLHNAVDIYAMWDYGAGQSEPDLAEIWDYSTGLRVASLPEHSYDFTWNPDGTKMVAVGRNANDDGLALEIWDVSNLPAVRGIPTLTPYPTITPTPNLVATQSD